MRWLYSGRCNDGGGGGGGGDVDNDDWEKKHHAKITRESLLL
jgi:hypothetical protein